MKVLVACEKFQIVCSAFREQGHEAYSCDIEECAGPHPEWHIKDDVRTLLKEYFDLVIFHPPCTYITNSGVTWLHTQDGRWEKMIEGCEFFNLRHQFNTPRIGTENPIPHKYAAALIGDYDQLIQPYHFGHPESKATCLWLKNLPPLLHTYDASAYMKSLPKKEQQRIHYMSPGPKRAEMRSVTFKGIADAMASQWGSLG